MVRIQKLIVLYLILLGISKLAFLGYDIYFSRALTGKITDPAELFKIEKFRPWLNIIPQIGTGIWLFVESRAQKSNSLIWTIIGLTLGLKGVALFYLVGIYTNRLNRTTEVSN